MIGAFLIGLVVGAGLVVLLMEGMVRPRYEQIIRIVQIDRDAVKKECNVYRNLLFPVMAKVEPTAVPAQPLSGLDRSVLGTKTFDERMKEAGPRPTINRRIPFRIRLKQGIAALNTKQQRTDALASALEKQPSGEKNNAQT